MDALKSDEIQKLLGKCKSIVGHFKRSTVASDELTKMQRQMNLPLLKVKQEVPTRWNSCLYMMERLVEVRNPLSAAMSNLSATLSPLLSDEWAILKDCISVLKPIEALTTELSGEKYITISTIIPLIRGLQHAINNRTPMTTLGKKLQEDLQDVISRRFASIEASKVCAKATFLDPRFKNLGFSNEDNANQTENWLIQEIEAHMADTQSQRNPDLEIPQLPTGKILPILPNT